MAQQRSTGRPTFRHLHDVTVPPEPPEDFEDEDGDDEEGHGHDRITQLLPADGWIAQYENAILPVACWALVQEFCEHGVLEGERVWGMVVPPAWGGGPAPYFIFEGAEDKSGFPAFGKFLGFERAK